MALTAQQIVTLACQIAKAPKFTSQCGQFLNNILEELSTDYDLQLSQGTVYFNFNPGLVAPIGSNAMFGSGPYQLPADWLRAKKDGVFWTLQGVPYDLIPCDLSEFDMMVQQAGLNSYPYLFAIDTSIEDAAAAGAPGPVAYVYPPPSGAYPVTARYQRAMPDIATPETSSAIPWFPNSTYLVRRCAGELMQITDDERCAEFLGEKPGFGAKAILKDFLKLADDKENRAQTVTLDRRRFGTNFASLPNTKRVGW